jgi:hypothetical protein
MVNSLLENYGGAHVHERNSNFSPGSEFQLRHTKQFVVHEGHNQTSAGDFTKHTSLGRLSAKQVAITIAIGPRVSLGYNGPRRRLRGHSRVPKYRAGVRGHGSEPAASRQRSSFPMEGATLALDRPERTLELRVRLGEGYPSERRDASSQPLA